MKKLSLLLTGLVLLGACKKDSENTPSKTDILTAKNWRISALTTTTVTTTSTSSTTTSANSYASSQACERDNFYKFNPDKTMIFDEGATKCSTASSQTIAFKWDFNSDQTKLLITPSGSTSPTTSTDDILELSSSTMRLRDVYTFTNNNTTTTTTSDITFTSF